MLDKSLKSKAIQIKGKDYVQVKDRILWLDKNEEDYSITTEYEYFEAHRLWVVKATLVLKKGVYTGLAQEVESDDYKQVNSTSALENCETSAVGRACAMAGIGVLDSIASVDEMHKSNNRAATAMRPPSDKQLKWIRDTAHEVNDQLGDDKEVDEFIREVTGSLPTETQGWKTKETVDKIKNWSAKASVGLSQQISIPDDELPIIDIDKEISIDDIPF